MPKKQCAEDAININQNPNAIMSQIETRMAQEQMDECALEIELEERAEFLSEYLVDANGNVIIPDEELQDSHGFDNWNIHDIF